MTNKAFQVSLNKGQRARVNIRTLVNSGSIRKERRHGRDKIIVPSVTMPDDIIMNGLKYPADEIANSFKSLNNTPAPLGHPTIDGMFVSASDPEGINIGWIGAHNENVRREDGRVLLDKVIDVQRANENAGGRAVLEAIEKGNPIHTSTGLFCELDDPEDDSHEFVARNIEFDHDAILLGEDGAATPEDGVGMMVNSAGVRFPCAVINSAIDMVEDQLDWAGMDLIRALERRQQASMWEHIKSALMQLMGKEIMDDQGDSSMTNNNQSKGVTADELDARLNTFGTELAKSISTAVSEAMKPLADSVAAMNKERETREQGERDDLVGKVVKANLLDETSAKAAPLETLRALAGNIKSGKADVIAGGGEGTGKNGFTEGWDLNAHINAVTGTSGKEGAA